MIQEHRLGPQAQLRKVFLVFFAQMEDAEITFQYFVNLNLNAYHLYFEESDSLKLEEFLLFLNYLILFLH